MILMQEEVYTGAYTYICFTLKNFRLHWTRKLTVTPISPDAVMISEVYLVSGIPGIGCDTLLEVAQGPRLP